MLETKFGSHSSKLALMVVDEMGWVLKKRLVVAGVTDGRREVFSFHEKMS